MRRMRYVSFALLLLASTAHSEDWQEIAKLDSNGGVLLFDAAGVTDVKGLRRAWFKSVYMSDQPVPNEYLKSVPAALRAYRSERTLRYFNCAERTGAVMRYFWDDADGRQGGYHYHSVLTFLRLASGSLDERMLETACNFTGEFADADAAKLQLPRHHARFLRPVNPDDYYPASSVRRGEEGAPIVQVCVGPDGKLLREPEILKSSGFPDLDAGATRAAKAATYAADTVNGAPVAESCLEYQIKFALRKKQS